MTLQGVVILLLVAALVLKVLAGRQRSKAIRELHGELTARLRKLDKSAKAAQAYREAKIEQYRTKESQGGD